MISENFIWVALAITVAGNIFYIKDTLKGISKPNRVTFFLWGAAPLIAFFSQRSGGGGMQILYTLVISAMPLLILAASFVDKNAYWKITKFDIACGTFSAVALICLLATDRTGLALILSLVADFCAALPTILKSYKFPDTETIVGYGAEMFASVLVLLTIHNWILVNYAFALYILLMCIMFTSILLFSPRRKGKLH